MAFIKRDVKDRVVQYPRRYQLVEVSQGIYDLVPVTGTVTEEGTAINKAYLQPIEDGLDAALEKTGDGKDVIVTFTEAATEAHITSGEKLSVMFGKILKMFKGKAPNSHASSGTTYGVGTTANYGHCKTINGLTQSSHVNGNALSAYQGKVLNDKIIAMQPVLLATLTPTPGGLSDSNGVLIDSYLNNNGNPYHKYIFVMNGNITAKNESTQSRAVTLGLYTGINIYSGGVDLLSLSLNEGTTKTFNVNNAVSTLDAIRCVGENKTSLNYIAQEYKNIRAINNDSVVYAFKQLTTGNLTYPKYLRLYGEINTIITNSTLTCKIYGMNYL